MLKPTNRLRFVERDDDDAPLRIYVTPTKLVLQQYWEEECPACEGTGNAAIHGLDPATCGMCDGDRFVFSWRDIPIETE